MNAEDFARRFCLILLRQKMFLEDSEPHRVIEREMRAYFPEVRKAITEKAIEAANPDPIRHPEALPATRARLTDTES